MAHDERADLMSTFASAPKFHSEEPWGSLFTVIIAKAKNKQAGLQPFTVERPS